MDDLEHQVIAAARSWRRRRRNPAIPLALERAVDALEAGELDDDADDGICEDCEHARHRAGQCASFDGERRCACERSTSAVEPGRENDTARTLASVDMTVLDVSVIVSDIEIAARAVRGSSWPGDMAQRMDDRARRLDAFAELLRSAPVYRGPGS